MYAGAVSEPKTRQIIEGADLVLDLGGVNLNDITTAAYSGRLDLSRFITVSLNDIRIGDTVVVGISPDALDVQCRFAEHYQAKFPIVADPDGAIARVLADAGDQGRRAADEDRRLGEPGGHVHQVLAAPQGPLLAPTPLTLAETASVFGEALTFKRLQSTPLACKRSISASRTPGSTTTPLPMTGVTHG